MNRFKHMVTTVVAKGLCLLATGVAISSCNTIFTDQSDCPAGLGLHFKYDYNMSYVNTLHKENDCLTVYIYDSEGNLVTTCTESGAVLADEDYRMDVSLPQGSYNIVAYGGMLCEKSSFAFRDASVKSAPAMMMDMQVELKHDDMSSDGQLHNQFHGMKGLEMNKAFVEDTVYMVKNTNNIRIILQQVQGNPLASSDFIFKITDDNTLMAYDNDVIPNGTITYHPWTQGEKVIGASDQTGTPVSVAYAEFSTARIMAGSGSRLTIARKDTEEVILSIPLDKYLLLLKSELYADMGAQEYLDREDEWSVIFFLDSGLRWLNTHIVINDWTVRLNHIGL